MWFLVTKLIQGELGIYLARMKRLAILYAVMVVFALLLVAFLITALFVVVSAEMGALAAALTMAGVCLGVIVLIWIATIVVRRKPAKRAEDRMKRDIASIAGVSALSNAPQLLRAVKRRKSLMLIPLLAGLGYGAWVAIKGDDEF
ncbi:MAG: hypothetical protein VYD57_06055 [Pseudomonadota bacterium]|nr:hypothetical protein [Pseudomonadota bacterium]